MREYEIIKYISDIRDIIIDYRSDDGIDLNHDHIIRWINQFDDYVQIPMLRELYHILRYCYLSKEKIHKFLKKIITCDKIYGEDLGLFWKNANILDIQMNGNSQKEIVKEFKNILSDEYGVDARTSDDYRGNIVYMDDFLYNGNRIFRDIENIISNIEDNTFIHIILIGGYKYGLYKTENRLKQLINSNNKKINFKIWKFVELENRQCAKDEIETYYPSFIPDNYIIKCILSNDKYQFRPRKENCYKGEVFADDKDRIILEEQFLLAGAKIISSVKNINKSFRPLGIGGYGLGFGSTIVSYRNCPNNAPLALWWGGHNSDLDHSLGKWYPLFPRKVYGPTLF